MGERWKKFRLLLWKNFLLKKRHWGQTTFEILIPLFFILILVFIRTAITSTTVSHTSQYPPFRLTDILHSVVPKGQYVLFAPNTSQVKEVIQGVELKFKSVNLSYQFVGYPNEKLLLKNYRQDLTYKKIPLRLDLNKNPVLAAIIFKNLNDDSIEYSLRFPAGLHGPNSTDSQVGLKPRWFTEFLFELFPQPGIREPIPSDPPPTKALRVFYERGGLPGYWREGFLFLQSTIDSEITRVKAKMRGQPLNAVDQYDVQLQRYPYPKYTNDAFISVIQFQFPLFIMFSYIYSIINISKSVAHEKERRLKESMKIMGLNNWLHWTAWFTKSFMSLLLSTILITMLCKIPWANGMAVLPNSDGSLIFIFLLVYACSSIAMGFLITTFFSTANAASTAAGVIFFLTYFPYFFIRARYEKLTTPVKLTASIFSNTAMALGCRLVSVFEGSGMGMQWSVLKQASSPDDDFTLFEVIVMLSFDGTWYFLLALYIESVFPGEYGVPLPWYYPFTKRYWKGTQHSEATADVTENLSVPGPVINGHLFEKEPQGHAGIKIQGLTKKFGKKVAVKNLCLSFYENQVTALLGHNGAGKTTTMSMITGLIPPTSGTAIVNGHDIRKDISSVRKSLGLCPQHDVLFQELTVEEHLRFFCLLKGMDTKYLVEEIDRMLGMMMLNDKRHAQSGTLSGGMKRKLSVGIALIGGSKVVLLDEPTAGMDPGARRSTWDLITNEKKGRTIVLSTHFMDEADLLGDRIAILAEGQARCCGSSLFLKKKYGGGYHLIIVKEPGCNVEEITHVLQQRIPEVRVDQNIGAELSYSLPDDSSSIFPELFDELENRKKQLGIGSYGCSITQMEEIFIRVGKQVEEEMRPGNKSALLEKTGNVKIDQSAITNSGNGTNSLAEKVEENSKNEDQLANNPEEKPPFTERSSSNVQNRDPNGVDVEHSPEKSDRNEGFHLLIQQFRAMMIKRWLLCVRNKVFVISQIFVPVIFLIIAMIVFKTLPDISSPKERVMNLKHYSPPGRPLPVTTVQCGNPSGGVCQAYINLAEAKSKIEKTGNLEDYILTKTRENMYRTKYRYIVGLKATNNDTLLTGFFNNEPFHSSSQSLNLISNAILRETTKNAKATLTVSNHPLPFTDTVKVGSLVETESEGFSIGLNVSFGLSFLAGSFVVFVIKERQTKCKHLQYVSGVRFPIFWLAHLLFDVVLFVLSIFALMITLVALSAKDFSGENSGMLGYFFLVLIFYAWAIIPTMYVCSLLFTVPSSGYTKMTLFNFVTGMATFLTVAILQLDSLKLKHVANTLEWYFMLFPNFDVGYALTLLALNRQLHNVCPSVMSILLRFIPQYCLQQPEFPCCQKYERSYLSFEDPGIGRHLLYLFFIGVFCSVILFLIESNYINQIKYKMEMRRFANVYLGKDTHQQKPRDSIYDSVFEDDDVAAENRRIRYTDLASLFQTDNLVVRDLTKLYGRFVAVDQLCLGVQHGECFGLLGINGAGKTTTFKMLTGDIHITDGNAYIANRSVQTEIRKVQKVVGYCPQFDALIPELTGRETIRLFARLRGIPEENIDGLVDELGADLLFSEHLDKQCGTYSGGNKRKLSVAVSLVGNPPLVLLDEPSAGIDPVAKRHLWNAVIKLREKGMSVVLTSHSLEECEALCTRLAIMVNGKFRCLGSTQHLKNKFGDGYTIIAQMESKMENEDENVPRKSVEPGPKGSSMFENQQMWEKELQPLRDFIEEKFPDCALREVHPGYVHYHIKEEKGITWANIFRTMEEAKSLFTLEAYSVGQTSLEQVFLSFIKEQTDR